MTQAHADDFRIVSTTDDPSLVEGLAARVADPAWMLARQWQFGEFAGEDAGSPAEAKIWTEISALTRFLPALPDGRQGQVFNPAGAPVEARTENEWQPRAEPSRRFATVAGLQFLRMLEAAGLTAAAAAYRARLPLPPNPVASQEEDPLLALAGGRAVDGQALFAELDRLRTGANPPTLDPPVEAVARRFLAWYDAMSGRALADSPAWVPERFEYQMALAGPTRRGELVLAASECDSGTVDWFSFDVAAGASLGAGSLPPATAPPAVRSFLPTPVDFHGMPVARLWEFENAAIDIGAVQAAPEDIATMLVVEFALRYGNDFFLVPIPLTVGTISRVGALVVTDTFGRRTFIRPASAIDADFRLFEHAIAGSNASEAALVVFPAVVGQLESAPIEEVVLLRDEAANVCWAVERVFVGARGNPIDRAAAWARRQPEEQPPPPSASEVRTRRYRLRPAVADYWFPLLSATAGEPTSLAADLRLVPVRPLPGAPPAGPPLGRILGALGARLVPAEEVTRTGRRVVRTWQYARGLDGTQHLWVGRRAYPAAAAAAPNLRFDEALDL